ncbi:MAG: dCMP deaminase family protein [Bacillota bacterium]
MRYDYISWDEYFMGVAKLSAMRSKDPSTQVGACIINSDKRIVGIGYNGLPQGCNDAEFSWASEGDYINTKYPYVVHAEANAILNATTNLKDSSIYVTLFPCNECTKLIIQSGIREIVFESDKYKDSKEHQAAIKMLNASGVKYRQINVGELSYVTIH